MIGEFKDGIKLKNGQKYIKVITGTSVWGFIAKSDGVLKVSLIEEEMFLKPQVGEGQYLMHVRGSIYDDSTSWFHWTGRGTYRRF